MIKDAVGWWEWPARDSEEEVSRDEWIAWEKKWFGWSELEENLRKIKKEKAEVEEVEIEF